MLPPPPLLPPTHTHIHTYTNKHIHIHKLTNTHTHTHTHTHNKSSSQSWKQGPCKKLTNNPQDCWLPLQVHNITINHITKYQYHLHCYISNMNQVHQRLYSTKTSPHTTTLSYVTLHFTLSNSLWNLFTPLSLGSCDAAHSMLVLRPVYSPIHRLDHEGIGFAHRWTIDNSPNSSQDLSPLISKPQCAGKVSPCCMGNMMQLQSLKLTYKIRYLRDTSYSHSTSASQHCSHGDTPATLQHKPQVHRVSYPVSNCSSCKQQPSEQLWRMTKQGWSCQ